MQAGVILPVPFFVGGGGEQEFKESLENNNEHLPLSKVKNLSSCWRMDNQPKILADIEIGEHSSLFITPYYQ